MLGKDRARTDGAALLTTGKNMRKQRKSHGSFKLLVFLPAALVGIGLLLAFLCGYLNPATFFFPALFGLAFPFIFILGIILFIFNVCLLRKRSLFFLVCLLLNWNNVQNIIQFKGELGHSSKGKDKAGQVKLMTYNVRMFDFYNLADKRPGEIKDEIMDFVARQAPDILCFQEYYESKGKGFDITSVLRQAGYAYSTNPSLSAGGGFLYGNRIYSKYPILRQGDIPGLSRFDAVYADILIEGDTLRVYNLHLASNRFDRADQEFFSSLASPLENAENYKKGAARMMKKLKEATKKRFGQIRQVMLSAEEESAPSRQVLCGDLNDQPVSYVYAYLERKGFRDAFVEKGHGLGQTYKGFYPSYRIDYILFKGEVSVTRFDTWKIGYSDHRPLSSVLKMASAAEGDAKERTKVRD